MDLDPDKARKHGPAMYQRYSGEYAANCSAIHGAVTVILDNLVKAADGLVDLLTNLELEHRQLDDVAERLNAVLPAGDPRLGPTPDHLGAALDALPEQLRGVALAGRRSRAAVLDALAAAGKTWS